MDETKKKSVEKLEALFDIYGPYTGEYFQSRLTKVVFILQNNTPKEVTKEQISDISTALEELYNLFEIPVHSTKKPQYEHRHKMTA